MAFTLTFNITADPATTLAKLFAEGKKAGVQFTGDDQQGAFAGCSAKGTYAVNGRELRVTVTEKPFFITESLVRNQAREKAPAWGAVLV
jgi:hypothetical protein